MRRPKVAVIQAYLPQYRTPFFERLRESLSRAGINLSVWAGEAPSAQANRNDEKDLPWAHRYPVRETPIGSVDLRLGFPRKAWHEADLVIVEHTSLALLNYWLAATAPRSLALWGHGGDFVSSGRPLARAAKNWQLRRSIHYFAYTDAGAQRVINAGVTPESVTIVHNTIDTEALKAAVDQVDPEETRAMQRELGVAEDTALFLGALDRSKRLEFLFEACARIYAERPTFRCLVAGDGPERAYVQAVADQAPWLRYVGARFSEKEKALLASTSRCIAMPGRVGLVAVDSFAMGIPLITTAWPNHAPEFEYLENGRNAIVSNNTIGEYARGLGQATSPTQAPCLTEGLQQSYEAYRLDEMVGRFVSGIVWAISS